MKRFALLALLGCVEAVPPADIRGVVYDPERHLTGEQPVGVAGAQVYMAEDDSFGAVSGDDGAYEMRDVPANYNWHPLALNEPNYFPTLDGLGTPVTDADLPDYWVPILRRGALTAALAEWRGIDESRIDTIGMIVVGVMDRRPPDGNFLREGVTVAIGGVGCPDPAWGFVVASGGSFAIVESPSGVPPPSFSGMAVATGPLGCIVTVSITDTAGALAFLPHDMAIDNRAAMFQLYVAE